jgi:glycosyltransferase involved in cell wall biosynthesis
MVEPKISFIVPLYNESESFQRLVERLDTVIAETTYTIEVVLVDDGSKDNTAQLMQQLALLNENYQCIFLSRNYGHPLALCAGLINARGTDGVMIIDGDLQDPPELLTTFYDYYQQGYDVVYGIRKKRKESWFKKAAYHSFYRLLKSISYIDMPLDTGDFSFISRRIVNIINKMPEESRYIRGMRTWVGFKQIGVEYEREERVAGTSKYSFKMLFQLAYNGIFNFSEFPIKFITNLGLLSVLVSILYLLQTIYKKIIDPSFPVGFTGLLFAIILFGGVQLISLGVIGEYVLRIFFQVKGRPLFVVKNKIVNKQIEENK